MNTNSIVSITNETGRPTVDARELHARLGSKQQFSTWIKYRLTQCDFKEGPDYTRIRRISYHKSGGSPRKDFTLSLSAAQSIALVEHGKVGAAARKFLKRPLLKKPQLLPPLR